MATPTRHLAAPTILIGLLAAGPAMAQVRDYELTIESDYQVRTREQAKAGEVHATSKLTYSIEAKPDEQVVSIHALEARVGGEKEPVLAHGMSRDRASFRQAKQAEAVFSRANAPPKLVRTLDDFDRPALSIRLDADGAETGRKILLKPDSLLVAHGILDNSRVFHPPFPRGADRWTAPVRISMSAGQAAEGRLTYERIADGSDPGDSVRVRITGELKSEGGVADGEIRNGVYKVEGEAAYSSSEHTWLTGRLMIGVTFDLFAPGELPNSASGTMSLSLREAPRGSRGQVPVTAVKPGPRDPTPRK